MKWGIMGPGNIVRRVSKSFAVTEGMEMFAIASRSEERAKAAAATYNAKRWYGSYEELVKDPDVEAVYVATPASLHCENTCLALEHGKPVMCEKPFAVTEKEAQRMVDCARANGVFLMEAMWTRFIPSVIKARQWVDEGRIGKVVMIQADMGFYGSKEPPVAPTLPVESVGGMLDIGVYTLSLATYMLHKMPLEIKAFGTFNPFGMDNQGAAIMRYDDGELVSMYTATHTESANEVWIYGIDGKIHIPKWFWCAQSAELFPRGGQPEVFEHRTAAEGFEFELLEVERCIREGLLESPIIPLDESIAIIKTINQIRSDWN